MSLFQTLAKAVTSLSVLLLAGQSLLVNADTYSSTEHSFQVELLTDQLTRPWGMVFLPSGDMLVTEHGGTLRRVRADGSVSAAIEGLPRVRQRGQGGLMGICLHPQFSNNGLVYLAYSAKDGKGYGTEVARARYADDALHELEVIFKAEPKSRGGRHFGSRLAFARDGTLFISLGDRGRKDSAQDLSDHRGSLIRIMDDGSLPEDNPFVNEKGARGEIFSYGHRNIQGMTVEPLSGQIWTHEHGPQGGDEINLISAGQNYGWPIITYGVNYGTGTRIGEGSHRQSMQQPLYKWVPSIAPSGMTFYTGKQFPHWQNNLFVGSLKFGQLLRLELEGNKVVKEERLLDNRYGRIRDVIQGKDGLLYLLTEAPKGLILKISPAGLN